MKSLVDTLQDLENALKLSAPEVETRLQPGLTRTQINQQVERFSWKLPEDVYSLYGWRDGLYAPAEKLSIIEKLLRQKDRWHGEISGHENELRVNYSQRTIVGKFMPLEYALAGHSHLKLGRCFLDLLPFCIVSDGKTKFYCMVKLEQGQSTVYCANGSMAPPKGITDDFLSTQIRFDNLNAFVLFLTNCAERALSLPSIDDTGYSIDETMFDGFLQQYSTQGAVSH